MLSYLVYISLRTPECTDAEIDKILKSCQSNNKHDDITGVLLYSQKQFVQYLEGENDKILALFDKIKQDPRHTKVIMMTNFPIKERAFPSWQMAGKSVDFSSLEYQTNINPQDKREFDKLLAGETSNQALNIIKKIFK